MNKREQINVVMFNMVKYSDWQKGIANRNYYVLHELVKRNEINKVICVDFLPFNWKRAVKTYIYDQILNDTQGQVVYGDLTSRCWQVSSKILVYSTIDSVLNKTRIITELKRIIAKEDMQENLLVWSYNPMYTDYFGQLDQTLNVFDAVEDWQLHSSYKFYADQLNSNYQQIKTKSNLIFTVSQTLKESLFANLDYVHWLPNAVDLESFLHNKEELSLLKKIPQPRLCFLGIINERLDAELLAYIAAKNPDKSIILAGPVWPSFPKGKLAKFKNVYYLGKIAHTDIPKLYQGCDLGIVPYKITDFIKTGDSMKYYELLAANLPVVTTKISGTERFGQLITVVQSAEEFNQQINQELNKNQSSLTGSIQQFLTTNNWHYRVEQMLELIYSQIKV